MKNKKLLYGIICIAIIGSIITIIKIILSTNNVVDLSKMLNHNSYKVTIKKSSDIGCIEFNYKESQYYYLIDYKNNIEYLEDNTYTNIPTKLYNTTDSQITWATDINNETVWYKVSSDEIILHNNYKQNIKNILKHIVDSDLKKINKEENLVIYKVDATEELITNFNVVLDNDFTLQDVVEITTTINEDNNIHSIRLSIQEKNEDELFADNCYNYELIFSDFNNINITIPNNIITDNGLAGTYVATITCSNGHSYNEQIVLTNNLKRFTGTATLVDDLNKINLMDCQNNQKISTSNVDYNIENNTLIISTKFGDQYEFEIKDNTLIKKDSQEIFSQNK